MRTLMAVTLAMLVGCADRTVETAGEEVWQVGPVAELSIGTTDGEAPYLLSRVEGVVVLNDGGVAVIDGGSQTIRVFDPNGTLRTQFGGAGQGPGEFADAYYLWEADDGSIGVYDVEMSRATYFRPDGTFERTMTIQPRRGFPALFVGKYSGGDLGFGSMIPAEQSDWRTDRLEISRFDYRGTEVASLGLVEGVRRFRASVLPFAARPLVAMFADTVYVGDAWGDTVQVIGPDGTIVRSIAQPAWTTQQADPWDAVAANLSASARERVMGLQEVPGADSIPRYSRLHADRTGRLWWKVFEASTDSRYITQGGTGGVWVISDREGEVVASASLPATFRPLYFGESHLAGVSFDPLGVEYVEIFPLRR